MFQVFQRPHRISPTTLIACTTARVRVRRNIWNAKHHARLPGRDRGERPGCTRDEVMTRDEALALYHPIRASVRRILSVAVPVCNQSDLMRAAKKLGLWVYGKIVLLEGGEPAEMLQRRRGFRAEPARTARIRFLSRGQGAATLALGILRKLKNFDLCGKPSRFFGRLWYREDKAHHYETAYRRRGPDYLAAEALHQLYTP